MERLEFLSNNKTLRIYDVNLMDHNRCFFCSYKDSPSAHECSKCIYVGLFGPMTWIRKYKETLLVKDIGSNFRLKCPTIDIKDKRKVCVSWYFNDKLLKANRKGIVKQFKGRVRIRRNGLFFKRISEEINGQFKCKAVDKIERVRSVNVFNIIVPERLDKKPFFDYVSNNVTVSVGETVNLEISVESTLHPLILWFHNPKSNKYSIENAFKMNNMEERHPQQHIIENVTQKDAGVYVITASNYFGTSVAKIFVDVIDVGKNVGQYSARKSEGCQIKSISILLLSLLSTISINLNIRPYIITIAEKVVQ
ncbi:unnamed protein product [Dimorphilus gyrociliatus]|uniref:Ig-like domain-containing protein n=1 Tax=Dimorphilus gyrociliatus TaxID=2664684 RepID=A0A7I8VW38_9ANNE|nr:unnamed protein product [Dimorphilus gyrociliatus]